MDSFPDERPDTGSSDPLPSRLHRRLAEGSPEALDRLIGRYWDPLTAYASRIVGDMTRAEDVVQEVFVRVWETRRSWPPRSPGAYLYRMTRNAALDEIRSEKARRDREETRARQAQRLVPTPAVSLAEDELREVVDRAIQALPERRREAFVLAYLRGLRYREISQVMDISAKTVGHHVSAALSELREMLRPLFDEMTGEGPDGSDSPS